MAIPKTGLWRGPLVFICLLLLYQPVKRTRHAGERVTYNARVPLGSLDISMAQQLLNVTDVPAIFQKEFYTTQRLSLSSLKPKP